MKRKISSISRLTRLIISVIILLVVIMVIVFAIFGKKDTVKVTTDNKIDITPVQVKTIRDIGEWEFLSVTDEEMVDTLRKGFFSDDELIRIYYGTLRLGVDLHKAKEGWITSAHDTVIVTLPPIELLDNDYVDEAKSKSFFETGKWSEDDRQAMYLKACRMMRRRCLNADNIRSAEQNAITQFSNLVKSMGFKNVKVRFEQNK